jgi:hypothetical protein
MMTDEKREFSSISVVRVRMKHEVRIRKQFSTKTDQTNLLINPLSWGSRLVQREMPQSFLLMTTDEKRENSCISVVRVEKMHAVRFQTQNIHQNFIKPTYQSNAYHGEADWHRERCPNPLRA